MRKRNKLEIIKDILEIIQFYHNSIKPTPLLRKSNLSSTRFKEYYNEMLEKEFITETQSKSGKCIHMTDKGNMFLEKYQTIINFIDEFEL